MQWCTKIDIYEVYSFVGVSSSDSKGRVFDFSPWHSLPFVSHNEGRVPPPVFASSEHQLYKKCQSFMFIKINFTCRSVLLLAFSLLCSNIGTLFSCERWRFCITMNTIMKITKQNYKRWLYFFLVCPDGSSDKSSISSWSSTCKTTQRGFCVSGDGSPDKEGTCSLLSTQECL